MLIFYSSLIEYVLFSKERVRISFEVHLINNIFVKHVIGVYI